MITTERIDEDTRLITNGVQKWFVKRVNGFSMWEIKPEKGVLPKYLDGNYTDASHAFTRVRDYLAQKNKD